MTYFLKYRQFEDVGPMEERFDTERQALTQAFACLAHALVQHVWIEDDKGAVVVHEHDIRSRCVEVVIPSKEGSPRS